MSLCIRAAAVSLMLTTLSASVLSDEFPSPERAKSPIASREPLSFQTMGLYGRWQPYMWDGPFDFLIMQGAMAAGDSPADLKLLADWNAGLLKARAAGKRVIADLYRGEKMPTPSFRPSIVFCRTST